MFKGNLCVKMSTNDKNNVTSFPNSNNNSDQPLKDENILRRILSNPSKIWNILNGSLAAAIIVAICAGLWNMYTIHNSINSLSEDIENLSTKIDEKTNDLLDKFDHEYQNVEDRLESYEDNYIDLNIQVGTLQNINNIFMKTATDAFQGSVSNLYQKDGLYTIVNSIWNDSDVIATDGYEKYTVGELAGQKLLLSYFQNDQEVYFYGQYSKNNRWDGNCIINVYENNKLVFVTVALYDDGVLEEYQQLYTYTTIASEEVWCISKRKCTENGNIGDSWNYYKDKDITKDFNLNNVQPSDIYTIGEIKKIITEEFNAPVEAFYHGKTLEGLYNDQNIDDDNNAKANTDRSYLVKFSKNDGTVRTLYVGNFVNGKLEDETGTAWYIVRDDEKIESKYIYCIGKFKENTFTDELTEDNFKNNLTEQEIKNIILPYFFKCELNWYGFDNL